MTQPPRQDKNGSSAGPNASRPQSRPAPTYNNGYSSAYLAKGYYTDDSKKQIRREIIVEDAERIAHALFSKKMTSTTLYRFFNILRVAYDQLQADKKRDFRAVVNKIDILEPEAKKAVQRDVAPHMFFNFIRDNVRLARQGEENLRAFLRHYQSVICYFPENKKN
ncbi:type III-A CRISPR-associated protein Csm2 [Tumebacillus flagellatus]|uniref:CRISPR system Cms protein Csm2 n=1 Tax=Tumebacillus flagellatus TaxID=1157490 RepID=A0A074LQ10_9BACL|nr:type III-A CRISPR-associated protein Csm2 [Tumebacillus flagellatus]KEO82570.1 hypothetical protein EL26_14385 [Tumebacillus flagellatus]